MGEEVAGIYRYIDCRGGIKVANYKKIKQTVCFVGIFLGIQILPISGQAQTLTGPQSYIEQQQKQAEKQEQKEWEDSVKANAVTGWNQVGDAWFYQKEDGTRLTNAMTPDGYYVNEEGIWKQEVLDILSLKVTAPEKFVLASTMKEWKGILSGLTYLKEEIATVMPENRVFRVYTDAICYLNVNGKTETDNISLEMGQNGEGYILRLSTDLGDRKNNLEKASTYDYEVFRFLCAQISSTPSKLADAIYQSWQGDNGYQLSSTENTRVGDAYVSYKAENGYGVYYISPVVS